MLWPTIRQGNGSNDLISYLTKIASMVSYPINYVESYSEMGSFKFCISSMSLMISYASKKHLDASDNVKMTCAKRLLAGKITVC